MVRAWNKAIGGELQRDRGLPKVLVDPLGKGLHGLGEKGRTIMKKLALVAVMAAFATPTFADDVFGLWKSEPGETGGYITVKMHACGSKICGTIQKVVGNDNKKPEGKMIIKNMTAKDGGKYSGGTIWAPDTDKTYKSKMTLIGNNLEVEGCVAIICRGQDWKRL